MENEKTTNEQELDLMQLFRMLLLRWHIIFAALIIVVGLVGFYTYFLQEDVYTARGTIAIKVDDDAINPATGYSLAINLPNSYIQFVTSTVVLDELQDRLAQNTNYEKTYTNIQLAQMIEATNRSNTIVLDISVTHPDPLVATIITNELIDSIDHLTESETIKNLQSIDIWGYAAEPMYPSGPNRPLYVVISIVIGLMVGVFGVFLLEFFDKTVKSSSDVEGKLGIRVLGVIPDYDMEEMEVAE